MKLEAVNAHASNGVEAFSTKDVSQLLKLLWSTKICLSIFHMLFSAPRQALLNLWQMYTSELNNYSLLWGFRSNFQKIHHWNILLKCSQPSLYDLPFLFSVFPQAMCCHPPSLIFCYVYLRPCCLQFASQTYSTAPGLTFDTQTPREYGQGTSTSEWLHMQIGGAYERVSWTRWIQSSILIKWTMINRTHGSR